MIQIIKHCADKFIVTCQTCGCTFTYQLSDLLVNKTSVQCPECHEFCCHSIANMVLEEKHS